MQVGGDGVGELGGIFHAHGGDHGLIVQRLAELYILLEHAGDALHPGLDLRSGLGGIACYADGSLEIAVGFDDLQNLAAFYALDQNLDVAVGEFERLDDVDDGADLEDVIGFGFVDRGVVLGGQKDFLVAGQSLFERAYARFPAHHERSHHIRKDDHVTNGHHG